MIKLKISALESNNSKKNYHIYVKAKYEYEFEHIGIRYALQNYSDWRVKALKPIREFNNYKMYGLHEEINEFNPGIVEFAVYYITTYEETIWDNNYNQNYFIGMVGGNIALNKAEIKIESSTAFLEGEIIVYNLGFEKNVGLTYSINNDNVWNQCEAKYTGTLYNNSIEVWKFKTTGYIIKNKIPEYKFAVYYNTAGGLKYWDNNFSQNYIIDKQGLILE
ncbi:MAG: hypothetical protein AB1782_04675 [Cyanobacteriota bacterium]